MADESLLDDELKSNVKKPQPRFGHVAVRLNTNIVVFGGACGDIQPGGLSKYYSHRVIWSYNLDIDRWIKFVLPDTQKIPEARILACAVVMGSDIYLYGGMRFDHSIGGVWKLSGTAARNISWEYADSPCTENLIAPRFAHAGWEYQNKLWVFGGLCPNIYGYLHDNEHFEFSERSYGYNNQLCCFDTAEKVWNTVKCTGMRPSPRYHHAVAQIINSIFLYGGQSKNAPFKDLYELNMKLLTWTKIQTGGSLSPGKCSSHSFIAISEEQILLYGGSYDITRWVLDIPSLSWRQYDAPINVDAHAKEKNGRYLHKAALGIHSVVILGGTNSRNDEVCHCSSILHVNFKPKRLLKLCLEVVYEYRFMLQCKWEILPRNLHAQLTAMCQLRADVSNDHGDSTDGNTANVVD